MNEEDYLKEVTNTETSMQYVKIGLDDSVLINGKWGILDFLGEDMIVIVGEDGKRHKLAYKDIKPLATSMRLPFSISVRAWS